MPRKNRNTKSIKVSFTSNTIIIINKCSIRPPIIIGFHPNMSDKRRNVREDIKNPRKNDVPNQEVVPFSEEHKRLKSVIQFQRTTSLVYGLAPLKSEFYKLVSRNGSLK